MTAAGADIRHPDLASADHWIRSLEPAPERAWTQLVREPHPHVAVSLEVEAPAFAGPARAVVFAGSGRLTGTLTVGEVLAVSAIDRVEVLGAGPADDDAVLDTREHVRPVLRDGALVLLTQPAAGGVLVPFETRDPTPCCADHAL